MKLDLSYCPDVSMARGSISRLDHAADTRLRCLAGSVWITVDGAYEDVVLEPGQSWVVPGPGLRTIPGDASAGPPSRTFTPGCSCSNCRAAWATFLKKSRSAGVSISCFVMHKMYIMLTYSVNQCLI